MQAYNTLKSIIGENLGKFLKGFWANFVSVYNLVGQKHNNWNSFITSPANQPGKKLF